MLEIINYKGDEYEFPCLVVLGCFDAIHTGHSQLLKSAKLQAKINGLDLGVMVFSEGKGGAQVYTFEEKLKFLEQFNVKFVLKVDYNDELKNTKPLDFLQNVEDKLNVKAYMSGKDFRFGAGAKGKSSTLKNYAEDEENGVWYMSVKDVLYNGIKISTTQIKSALTEGDIKTANELLGRNYSLTAGVIAGADRGGKVIGFPTMNLVYPEAKVQVKQGVYAVKCTVDGTEYSGIANYGPRPTFDENDSILEVYLDGFSDDYYGKELTVEFTDYIRDIRKFESAEALSEQLKKDLQVLNGGVPAESVEELAVADETQEETAENNVTETAPEETAEEALKTEEDNFEDELEEAYEGESAETAPEETETPVEEPEQILETESAVTDTEETENNSEDNGEENID